MADEHILDRLEKLVRIAAPGSGATESEQESAALEVVRLVVKHDLTFTDGAPKRTEKTERADKPNALYNVWVPSVALQFVNCSACNKRISKGDIVWLRVKPDSVEYRHRYKPCTPA